LITYGIQLLKNIHIQTYSDQTRYFKLGLLDLPQNGFQATIKLNACQGYQLSSGNKTAAFGAQNYCCKIFIYSGNAVNTAGCSIALASGSNTSGQTDYGCFHYGFASNNTQMG
jgi:hypothetical protein